jgi:hypothetical protein
VIDSDMTERLSIAAVTVLVCLGAVAAPANAQGGFIGASLVGDIARFDQYEALRSDSSGGGEALGFGLRIGNRLGERWGLELEFVRPSEITTDIAPDVLPLLTQLDPVFSTLPPGLNTPGIVLPYSYRIETRQRNATLSASIWIQQQISPKFSLAYLGGVAFGRTSREVEVHYELIRPSPLPGIAPIVFPPTISKTTTYDVGPLVGMEGRIGLTEHVHFVPGVRLHAIEGGWLIRPSVGLSWIF